MKKSLTSSLIKHICKIGAGTISHDGSKFIGGAKRENSYIDGINTEFDSLIKVFDRLQTISVDFDKNDKTGEIFYKSEITKLTSDLLSDDLMKFFLKIAPGHEYIFENMDKNKDKSIVVLNIESILEDIINKDTSQYSEEIINKSVKKVISLLTDSESGQIYSSIGGMVGLIIEDDTVKTKIKASSYKAHVAAKNKFSTQISKIIIDYLNTIKIDENLINSVFYKDLSNTISYEEFLSIKGAGNNVAIFEDKNFIKLLKLRKTKFKIDSPEWKTIMEIND